MIGEKAPWWVGPSFSEQFKKSMTIDAKVLEWLKGALAEHGVVL